MSVSNENLAAEPVTVPLRDIERELSRQMKAFHGPGEAPVHRAHMSNLVIFTNSQEKAAEVSQQIPEIVAVHPARVLLLTGENSPGSELVAQVCVRPLGTKHIACSEQISLAAKAGAIDRLPFAVRALLVGDLPTNLWWESTQPPPLAGPLLYELAEQAQQIIYDSIGWMEPARGVAATATWLSQINRLKGQGMWRVASDLNWRRLKYWRRLLGQAISPFVAECIDEVVVEHGPHAVIQGWELVSWLARRLGWKVQGGKVQPGVEIVWKCDGPKGDVRIRVRRLEAGSASIHRVRVQHQVSGTASAMNFVVESDLRLAVHEEGSDSVPRTITTPPISPAELVGKQLSDRESDPVFYQSMEVAQTLAQSVLK